jgi:hypothetical protein
MACEVGIRVIGIRVIEIQLLANRFSDSVGQSRIQRTCIVDASVANLILEAYKLSPVPALILLL